MANVQAASAVLEHMGRDKGLAGVVGAGVEGLIGGLACCGLIQFRDTSRHLGTRRRGRFFSTRTSTRRKSVRVMLLPSAHPGLTHPSL